MIFSNIYLDPVTLSGEGEYNLDILKEIAVTDSFLGLSEDLRGCKLSMDYDYDNCTTEAYLEQIKLECGCLPFSLNLMEKVDMFMPQN